jgi:alkanesulfonate monooxygenase SsuD/methylene tetrahydromethanopterin reductase-like flavin-dependent oxidoreductase (luciferase family)
MMNESRDDHVHLTRRSFEERAHRDAAKHSQLVAPSGQTAAMALRVGVSTPSDLWSLDADGKRHRLAAIADAGLDHVFTGDHVSFIDGGGMDGPVHLAAMSGIEPRLDLHLGVYLLALRHPVVAARQLASLAQAAPGRVTVGIGVGGEDRHEIEVCEIDPRTRGPRTDAALFIVRSLLAGKTVSGDGEFYQFANAAILPKPDPRLPFMVGGRSDAALDRAGRLGDGWLAGWCSARRFKEGVTMVEEIGERRKVDWQHGLQVWVGVGANPAEARTYVSEAMQDFYKLSFDLFERYTPMGTAQQIAEFLAPYVRAGVSVLNLTPCGPDRETELETIAEVRKLLGG